MTADSKSKEKVAQLLDVNEVSYRYGSLFALNKVSFEAEAGELIALVGRNGAGKSTLLRCIAGWTRATDGDIKILGTSVKKDERSIREHVILVPDTPPFYDELTAWEHLQFCAQANLLANWEEEAEQLLDTYGLLSNRNAYKLALCIALLIEPDILLLDEPLGPLDPVSADDLWREINLHRNDGMTIILSSHQLPYEAHPDRYIIMEQGEVIAQGTPDNLRKTFKIEGALSMDAMLRSAILAQKAARHDK